MLRIAQMLLVPLAALGVYAAAYSNLAMSEPRISDAEHCVSLRRIDRTEVIDDHQILFYMKGGNTYVNRLTHRCPGLKFEESFMYRTSIGQLCNVDIITILENIGFGFTTGVSCGLGMFHPVTEEEAEDLKAAADE